MSDSPQVNILVWSGLDNKEMFMFPQLEDIIKKGITTLQQTGTLENAVSKLARLAEIANKNYYEMIKQQTIHYVDV